jgi:hypothetical protein
MKVTVPVEDDSGGQFSGEAVLKPRSKGATAIRREKAPAYVRASNKPPKPKHVLKGLHEKGVFKAEKTFAAIEQEVANLECNFPRSTLMMALGSARFLTRRGTKGNYRWIQKYKPGG